MGEGQRTPPLAVQYHPEYQHLLRTKVMSATVNDGQRGLSIICLITLAEEKYCMNYEARPIGLVTFCVPTLYYSKNKFRFR